MCKHMNLTIFIGNNVQEAGQQYCMLRFAVQYSSFERTYCARDDYKRKKKQKTMQGPFPGCLKSTLEKHFLVTSVEGNESQLPTLVITNSTFIKYCILHLCIISKIRSPPVLENVLESMTGWDKNHSVLLTMSCA